MQIRNFMRSRNLMRADMRKIADSNSPQKSAEVTHGSRACAQRIELVAPCGPGCMPLFSWHLIYPHPRFGWFGQYRPRSYGRSGYPSPPGHFAHPATIASGVLQVGGTRYSPPSPGPHPDITPHNAPSGDPRVGARPILAILCRVTAGGTIP